MLEETVTYAETDEEPLLDAPEDYGWTDGVSWHERDDDKDEADEEDE